MNETLTHDAAREKIIPRHVDQAFRYNGARTASTRRRNGACCTLLLGRPPRPALMTDPQPRSSSARPCAHTRTGAASAATTRDQLPSLLHMLSHTRSRQLSGLFLSMPAACMKSKCFFSPRGVEL